MKKEFWLIIILGAIIVALASVLLFLNKDSFNEIIPGSSDIRNLSVKSGQEITSPLVVEGEAKGTWFFEASFPIKITDEQGNTLGSSFVRAQSGWMTEDFVSFKGEITYASKTGGKGFLVLVKDNPSGLPENAKEIKIPVVLPAVGYTKIKVFFNNSKMDPEFSCNKVFPAEREILKIEAIGTAALNELLNGPTSEEEKQGFFTSINPGVELNYLANTKMDPLNWHADFNEMLEKGVGGSCRVSAIRAQITETLKQFETIKDKNVVISINGRTEDILQP